MKKQSGSLVVFSILFWIVALILTITFFYTFIPRDKYGMIFNVWLGILCLAETVCFVGFSYGQIQADKPGKISTPGYITIETILILWFIMTLFFAYFALTIPIQETKTQNLISLLYGVLTSALLFACLLFYYRDIHQESIKRAADDERSRMAFLGKNLGRIRSALSSLSTVLPKEDIPIDRLLKRVDMLEIVLYHIPPGRYRISERTPSEKLEGIEEDLKKEFASLSQTLEKSAKEDPVLLLSQFEKHIQNLENLISDRERILILEI